MHDNLMFEKEEEMRFVQKGLQEVEIELTRLKVEGTATTNLPVVSFANVTSNTSSGESLLISCSDFALSCD